jgi:hypothetical protein
MFEKWDENRGIQPNIPRDFDLIDLFSVLAAKIYGDAELESGVSTEWLLSELTTYFAIQYIERSKAFIAAKTVLEFITGRAWVMSDVGSDVYSFTHRTFLEFFYARQLEQGCETVRGLFRLLLPHIKRQEWDVVCHLALQIKTFRNQPRTAQAMQVLGDLIEGLRRISMREIGISLFAARALEYLLGTEQSMTELVRSILSLILEPAGNGQELGLQCIDACCTVCTERRECIHNVIRDFLIDRFVNPENGSDVWVADVLSHGEYSYLYVDRDHLPEPLCNLIDNGAIQAAVRTRASTSMHYAALRWEWYGEITEDEFRRCGFAMFFEDLRPSRQRHRGISLLSAVPGALRPHFYARVEGISARHQEMATRAGNLLKVISRAFSAETARLVTTNEHISPAVLSPGLWRALFYKARGDNELFLGALAIFTLFTFSLASARRHVIAPSISEKRWAAAEPDLLTRIERSVTYHRCGSHPIALWYREQVGKGIVPELATVS